MSKKREYDEEYKEQTRNASGGQFPSKHGHKQQPAFLLEDLR